MSRKVLKKLVQTFIVFFILLLIFVSFAPSSIAGQNCFGIGTPQNVVLQIMGRPTDIIRSPYLNEETWYYGISFVTFKYGKVYEYWNFGNLKVWLGSIKKDAPPIKIGATKNSVLNAMGTPTAVSVFESLNKETWYYGISSITFQDNKVYEYDNFGNNLKVYAKTWTKSVSTINKSSTKSNEILVSFLCRKWFLLWAN